MKYELLMYSHLATVVPCIFLGAYLLSSRKGTYFIEVMRMVVFKGSDFQDISKYFLIMIG
ncbi:hypothetical protein [Algoriphagus aquimarinus]|uniref:hypothetical protein n=1 Tax=Algoriphagus aquimarinus TaxID=237018 RepID=UPI0030D8F6F2